MTPRSLFNLILKILGIFLIRDTLIALGGTLEILATTTASRDSSGMLAVSLLGLLIQVFVCYCLVIRTQEVIKWFRLEKGFDQDSLAMNIHRSTILNIAIIVIGGYSVVQEIPNLCRYLLSFYMERTDSFGTHYIKSEVLLISAVKVVIGILLLFKSRRIVAFVELLRRR